MVGDQGRSKAQTATTRMNRLRRGRVATRSRIERNDIGTGEDIVLLVRHDGWGSSFIADFVSRGLWIPIRRGGWGLTLTIGCGREDFRKFGGDDFEGGRYVVGRGGRHGHLLRRGGVLRRGRLGHGFRRGWDFYRRGGRLGPEAQAPKIFQGRGPGAALFLGQFGDIEFGVVARVVRLVDGHGVSPWLQ